MFCGSKKLKKYIFLNILATALKSYIKWLLYIYGFFFLKKFKNVGKTVFLGLILRFSNLNVIGLLLQDWVFRLGTRHHVYSQNSLK